MDQEPRTQITGEKPLFLAPQARQGDGSGYLNEPLRRKLPEGLDEFELADHAARAREATRPEDEPECVGPAIVDGYAELADFQHTLRHKASVEAARQARPLLDAEDRIRDAERRAKHAHRNLSHEFHLLRLMLERAERGGRQTPESAIRKLERIEATLDGVSLKEAA